MSSSSWTRKPSRYGVVSALAGAETETQGQIDEDGQFWIQVSRISGFWVWEVGSFCIKGSSGGSSPPFDDGLYPTLAPQAWQLRISGEAFSVGVGGTVKLGRAELLADFGGS